MLLHLPGRVQLWRLYQRWLVCVFYSELTQSFEIHKATTSTVTLCIFWNLYVRYFGQLVKLLGTQKIIPQSPNLCRAGHVETRKELETAWEPQSNFLRQLIFLHTPAHRGALLCSFCLYRKTRFAKKEKRKKNRKTQLPSIPSLRFHYPGRVDRYQRKADSNVPTSGLQSLAINCSLGLFGSCGGHVLTPPPQTAHIPPLLSCEGAKPWGVAGLLGNRPSVKPHPG